MNRPGVKLVAGSEGTPLLEVYVDRFCCQADDDEGTALFTAEGSGRMVAEIELALRKAERAGLLEEWLRFYREAVRFGSSRPGEIADALCPVEDVPAVSVFRHAGAAKHDTGAAAVAALRVRATDLARKVLAGEGFVASAKKARPIDRAQLSAMLDTTCTCIELLTVNGNYARERSEALARARLVAGRGTK